MQRELRGLPRPLPIWARQDERTRPIGGCASRDRADAHALGMPAITLNSALRYAAGTRSPSPVDRPIVVDAPRVISRPDIPSAVVYLPWRVIRRVIGGPIPVVRIV